MKKASAAAMIGLAAALFCGCLAKRGPVYHAGDETPPEFLTGPVAALLTNVDGWSAEVAGNVTTGPGVSRTFSGEILEREGRLIFQPSFPGKKRKANRTNGLFFIWDEDKHSGYVLSDALQAYAPIKSEGTVANEADASNAAAEEEINGHACHRSEVAVTFKDGTAGRLVIWKAADLKHLPVRIESIHGANQTTLNFTEVRLESPPQELFSPPDGFVAYASPVSLMNELIIRESALSKKYQGSEFGAPEPMQNTQSWRPQGGVQ